MELLGTFIIFNIINVVIQTIKSICTIKCNKWIAAIVNAIAYGLYTYIIFIIGDDSIGLWFKIVTVALANLVGVFIVKLVEEKKRKTQLWKVEATISKKDFKDNKILFDNMKVPHNYIEIGSYTILNFYCATREQSEITKKFITTLGAKYFVSESKTL